MKGLYSFEWDCGRMGEVEGLFIATKEDVKNLIGKEIYFGEILGKHSEVFGTIEEGEVVLKTDNPEAIKALVETLGDGTISGYNPFDYLEDEQEDEQDDWGGDVPDERDE